MAAPIRLMTHNRQWEQEFLQSKSLLLWATEGWVRDVQHIGSTAIADGIAQPVIDMVAGLHDLKGLNEAALLIEGLNYQRILAPDWCGDELSAMLIKPRSGEVTHSVLLVRHGGSAWTRTLAVRNWLAENLFDWQQFQNLKRDHFVNSCDAAVRYAEAKSEYFQSLEQRI